MDAFFLSLAEAQRSNAIGVVLSGADADGTQGLLAIKRAGGITFAQDSTAKVGGMPESSIATGAVDFILPPDAIARELGRLSLLPQPLPVPDEFEPASPGLPQAELTDGQFQEILGLLRSVLGVDLSEYKQNTVRRRILRRMHLHRMDDVAEFIALLRGSPAELKSVHTDILIHVTRFFRDPEAFRALRSLVIPRLVERARRERGEALRIWVPGCATGEEVYSIAICVLEALGDAAESVLIQIFGTDISEAAIVKARAGTYAADIQSELAPEQLQRFFIKTDAGFQVCKTVRDICVFAVHDVVRDPPFSRLDLISCRNVLIYMGAALQRRIIPLFHYGLNPGGYLFLGAAESVGTHSDLFTPLDKRWNLYERAQGPARPCIARAPFERTAGPVARLEPAEPSGPSAIDPEKEAARFMLSAYAPPGVVIDDQMEVLYVLGRTGPFLELPLGKTSHHLLSLAREGLHAGISRAVRGSLESNAPTELPVRLDGDGRELEIRVVPLGADRSATPRYRLVIFAEPKRASSSALPVASAPERTPSADEAAAVLARSRDELEALRLHLQAVIERYEAAHEELQSANEEITSSNEELQSTNEELQTTKEEVEASNEELSTVNDELQARIGDLARLNDDLSNVLASVQIPIVILNRELRIRSFTPAAAPLFNLISTDVGRPLSDINIGVGVPELRSLLHEVLDTLGVKTVDVQERAGRWYTLRIRPYRTQDNRIDGLILALVDIDEIKRATQQIADARDYAEAIVATVPRPLLVLDPQLRLQTANPEFYRTFAVSPEESEGRPIHELGNQQWDIPELRERLQEVGCAGQDMNQFEVEHEFPRIGRRTMLINARRIEGREARAAALILVAIDDITERRRQERMLEERDQQLLTADTRKNEFLAMLAHELRTPLAPIVHAGSLLVQSDQLDPPSIRRAADIIVRQSSHMARLIEDLLDVARITRGKVELRRQQIDLRAPIERAVEAARPLLNSRRHDLQVALPSKPIEVDADPARLEQIIGNLLNNAARYTEPGGHIELTAELESGWAVIRVRDDGIGISAEMLPRVFELFTQADRGLDHGAGGLGIGLTVVRSLVEMHRGSVEARSGGRGQGSEFIVRLPALGSPLSPLRGSLHASSGSQEGQVASKPHRVLIVEDNEDAAAALGELLGSWGHDVRVVSSGPAALDAAAILRPHVILLDIGLPGLNGYEIARRLRQLPGQEGVRIVAMTGYGQAEDRLRSQKAGFDQHLVKPVKPQTLQQLFAACPV